MSEVGGPPGAPVQILPVASAHIVQLANLHKQGPECTLSGVWTPQVGTDPHTEGATQDPGCQRLQAWV